MPQHQSQHKTTTDSAVEVANASAPDHPLITHASATSCPMYTCGRRWGWLVLSLAKAAKDYYLRKLGEISPGEDYYLRGGTATGMWQGRGATELGLSGKVTAEGLVRLFDGQHPGNGEQLGRSLRRDGVAAWDVTFSADKSVSLLWALGSEATRRQVLKAFDDALTGPNCVCVAVSRSGP